MKIKMLESRSGSPDGISTLLYEKGQEYCLPDDLAWVFIDEKWAVKASSTAAGKKDLGSAPENKSAKTRVRKSAGRKFGK